MNTRDIQVENRCSKLSDCLNIANIMQFHDLLLPKLIMYFQRDLALTKWYQEIAQLMD